MDSGQSNIDGYIVFVHDVTDQIHWPINKSDLARRTGLPVRTIRAIFNGERRFMHLTTAERICIELDLVLPNQVFPKGSRNNGSGMCLGCGVPYDQRTRGCFTCYLRHRERRYRAKHKKGY